MQETTESQTQKSTLLLASIKLLRKTLVFHRDWSGNMFAKAIFDSAPVEMKKVEAAKKIWHWWCRRKVALESMFGGAEVFFFSRGNSGASSRKTKGFSAIVFGQSPLRLLCNISYTCFIERCTKQDLISFMKDTFKEPNTDIMNFASAWNHRGNFFESDDEKKNLRLDFSALVEERFSNVNGSGRFDSCEEANIFRIVRFCHLQRDTLPKSIKIFKSRFKNSVTGLKRKDTDDWIDNFTTEFKNSVSGSFATSVEKKKNEIKKIRANLKKLEKELQTVVNEIEKLKKNDPVTKELVGREKIAYLDTKPAYKKWNALDQQKDALLEKLQSHTEEIKKNNEDMKRSLIRFYRSGKLLKKFPSIKAFQNKLDMRSMREYLSFLCTCPEYWKVARDFPSAIMKYVLKDCQRNGKCTVCKAMCDFHMENIRSKSMDLMLAPQSPFLRRSGQEVFVKNIELCVTKWKGFARFPGKFKHLVPALLFQRMEIYKKLVQLKSWRASTVYEVPEMDRERLSQLELSTNSIFHGGLLPIFFEDKRKRHIFLNDRLQGLRDNKKRLLNALGNVGNDELKACTDEIKKISAELDRLFGLSSLLPFVEEVLFTSTLFSPNSNKFMFAHDFVQQLRLCIALRSVTVYKGLIPAGCRDLKFPNSALKAFKPSRYLLKTDGPVCFAFARRWRVKDLANRIFSCMEEGQSVCLHVEGDAPFMFHPRDDLQDWFKEVEWSSTLPYRCIEASDEAYPVSFKGGKQTKPFKVSTVSQLKELMDLAVQGDCYLLCSLEKKRKALLEPSRDFRGDKLRRVLMRSYPQAGNSSYALLKLRADCLTKRDLDNELTISTAAKVNIFGPRKTVYCIGDMWTETALATANCLATDELFTIELEGSMLTSKHKFWNFNRKPVKYKDPPLSVPFSNCCFQDIVSFVDKVVKNEQHTTKEKKEQEERVKKINKIKEKSKELQLYREAKQKNGLEQWREDTKKRPIEEAGSSGTGLFRRVKTVRYI